MKKKFVLLRFTEFDGNFYRFYLRKKFWNNYVGKIGSKIKLCDVVNFYLSYAKFDFNVFERFFYYCKDIILKAGKFS